MNDEILVEETEEVLEDFSANLHPYDLPGEWFVLNAQSGHEKKVRTNILTRIKNLHLDDKVYDVVIPTDEVVEIRNGKKVNVEKKTFPGYVLVRMDLDDTTWYEIRNTPSIIGFVGSLVVIRPGFVEINLASIAALGTGVLYGFYLIVTRKLHNSDSPLLTLLLTGVVGLIIGSIIMPTVWVQPTITEWYMMFAIGFFASIGHLFLILSLK